MLEMWTRNGIYYIYYTFYGLVLWMKVYEITQKFTNGAIPKMPVFSLLHHTSIPITINKNLNNVEICHAPDNPAIDLIGIRLLESLTS